MLYWPMRTKDIEAALTSWNGCLNKLLYAKKRPKSIRAIPPDQATPIIHAPKLQQILFFFSNNNYVSVFDYSSCFPIIRKPVLPSVILQPVFDVCHSVFSDYVIPEEHIYI